MGEASYCKGFEDGLKNYGQGVDKGNDRMRVSAIATPHSALVL
jgi:hypothetical protein